MISKLHQVIVGLCPNVTSISKYKTVENPLVDISRLLSEGLGIDGKKLYNQIVKTQPNKLIGSFIVEGAGKRPMPMSLRIKL